MRRVLWSGAVLWGLLCGGCSDGAETHRGTTVEPDSGAVVDSMAGGGIRGDGALWKATLKVTNGAGVALHLVFGTALGATAGVDRELGEVELPPLPPATGFDVRFATAGSNGSRTDLRAASEGETQWTVDIQAGAGGYPVTLAWNREDLPAGGQVTLRDAATGGQVLEVDMLRMDRVRVTNAAITRVVVAVARPGQ